MIVTLPNDLPSVFWTQDGKEVPATLTGTIRREFKNGCVSVAVKELGGAVHHFDKRKIIEA